MVVVVGCKLNPLLLSKCEELKDLTLDNMKSIEDLNTNYGYNWSYEHDIEGYNRLCADVTGEIKDEQDNYWDNPPSCVYASEVCCQKDQYGIYPSGCEQYIPNLNISTVTEKNITNESVSENITLDIIPINYSELIAGILTLPADYSKVAYMEINLQDKSRFIFMECINSTLVISKYMIYCEKLEGK